MASIEGVIRAKLLADSAVASLVGTRVHPEGDTPADAGFPRIEYGEASQMQAQHLRGLSNLNGYALTLECHALRKSEMIALVKALRVCLLGQSWSDSGRGFQVKGVFWSDDQESTTDLDDGGEVRVCTRAVTIKVWFRVI